MKIKLVTLVSALAACLSGCGMNSVSVKDQPNHAIVVSRIGDYGSDLDKLPSSTTEFPAYVSWINGKAVFPATPTIDLLPGEYDVQVGIACSNTATCHPSKIFNLRVEAGYRYVLKPDIVLVSPRSVPRSGAKEIPYHAPRGY